MFRRPFFFVPALVAASLATVLVIAHSATAQSSSGTVTGRVVWGPCIRGIPLPAMPDSQGEGQVAPGAPVTPGGQVRPLPVPAPNGLPAGAVLVAVQNTSISARTDEGGQFTLSGVPAGQYLTIAAGPVANASSATTARPNVFVNGGESVDVGMLSLGGSAPLGLACRVLPGMGAPGETEPSTPPTDVPNGP